MGVVACTSNIIKTETDEVDRIDRQSQLNSLFFCDLSPFGYGHYRTERGTRYASTRLLSGCSFVIRRETVVDLGYLFDEQLWMYVEDTDLSLRIHNLGHRICAVRDSVVYHLHNNDINSMGNSLRLSARAIMNRVYVFFKNMGGFEFLLFSPFLFFGGIFKILEFSSTRCRKIIYFVPFGIFSVVCMLLALLGLPGIAEKKRLVLKNRRVAGFHIIKLLLKHNP
jgi:GT2 family glycosyltransferase